MKVMVVLLASCVAAFAGLTFEHTLMEFRPAPGDPHVTAVFSFRNDRDKPLRIVKYDAACTCMTVTIDGAKHDYAPGEVGVMRAVFKLAGYYGTVDRVIAVWLEGDTPAAPSARLTVRAHIPQLMKIEPRTITWDLNQEPVPQVVAIEMDPDHTIHVLETQSSSDNFLLELKTIEAGRRYEMVVTPKSTAIPGIAAFRVDTDSEIESVRSQSAFGVIRKPAQ